MDVIRRNVQDLKRLQMAIVGNEIFRRARVENIKAMLKELPAVRELRLTNMTSKWAELVDWDEMIEMVRDRADLRILVNHANGHGDLAKTSCWKLLKEARQRERARSFDTSSEDAELCPHKGLRHWHDGSMVYFASQ